MSALLSFCRLSLVRLGVSMIVGMGVGVGVGVGVNVRVEYA